MAITVAQQKEFIEKVATFVKKYAPQFNICVYSPIIAQACLESAYGTSDKVYKDGEWRHNYFGLKWRDKRCAISNTYFCETTREQNTDGSYTTISSKFFKFNNLEECVIGYFQFTAISNYSNLKGVTDPRVYLENIKADKYATDIDYVSKVMAVITKWNLTQYDQSNTNTGGNTMAYTNSSLVNYTKLSPNKTSPRNHKIDTITIHHMAGNLTIESCGNLFANPSRQGSSNYGVGTDGRIALYVEEKDRAWCSGGTDASGIPIRVNGISGKDNDHRAVTIEVANDGGANTNWHVSDKAIASLINLVADICKRNGIKELKWQGDKSLVGNIEKQNLTVHRWFARTACPGDYLYSKLGYIAEEVNKKLGITTISTPNNSDELYRVRKTWEDAKSQIGAFKYLDRAKDACPLGYSVYDSKGNVVYSNNPSSNTAPFTVKIIANSLNIRKGAGISYPKVGEINDHGVYTITKVSDGWGYLKSGKGWISLNENYVKRL